MLRGRVELAHEHAYGAGGIVLVLAECAQCGGPGGLAAGLPERDLKNVFRAALQADGGYMQAKMHDGTGRTCRLQLSESVVLTVKWWLENARPVA